MMVLSLSNDDSKSSLAFQHSRLHLSYLKDFNILFGFNLLSREIK